MRTLAIALALALFGAPGAAQGFDLDKAKGLYKQFCAHCHGIDMVNPGTSSFDLRKFPVDQKDRFYTSVMDGRGDMPAWGDVLFPEELDLLWAYVASRGGKEPLPEDQAQAIPAPQTLSEGVLTVCMARNAGVLSGRRHQGGTGVDYRVSAAVADRLGLSLAVLWTEGEPEEESDPVRETYALLAHGMCDVAPSHPLYAGAVGAPPAPNARLPRWLGMPQEIDPQTNLLRDVERPLVRLEPVAVSAPYMRAGIGIAYRAGAQMPRDLGDLHGLRVAFQQGTLSGAIATAQLAPEVLAGARMHTPGARFLWEVELGAEDAAIVDVAAFDAHLKHNPASVLRLADWRHPIGFDIGFAVLERNAPLLAAVNGALADLLSDAAVDAIARDEGLSYDAPLDQGIAPPLDMKRLMALR